jgi:polyisoprenyl-phosphate glycosyltransferase
MHISISADQGTIDIPKYSYSIVLPIYNEEESLEELYTRVCRVMAGIGETYEIVFVNDGSKDNSLEILKGLNERDSKVKIVNFSRNFGHQIAVSAGIDYAIGNTVVVMDADLQDPPEILPKFIDKLKEGYDVVYAVRKKRPEGFIKRFAYTSFYRILGKISHINMPLDSGDFCVMDRRIVGLLKSMPERNRFVRGIRSWVGFRQIGLEYERDGRYAGKSKYTISKLLKLAFDGFISFSYLPLQLASYLGFVISSISFLGALIYLSLKLFTHIYFPRGFPTTLIIILFLGGIQLMTIGIIGEYIGRVYDEVKQRPLYIVEDLIGFDRMKIQS